MVRGAIGTTDRRRHDDPPSPPPTQQHSRRPFRSLPTHWLPPPLPRPLLPLTGGYGWASGTGGRRRRDDPPSQPPTATQSSTDHHHPRSPVAAVVAKAAAISLQPVRLSKRYRGQPLPAAHLPPLAPVTVVVATAAAISSKRVRLGKRYHPPPPPRRPTVVTADNNTVVGHSPSSPPNGRRRRFRGCCYLLATGSVGQAVQPQQCRRPLNLISAPHSPPPLARLPLVEAAPVGSEGMKATTAAATTGRRRRKRHSRRSLTSVPTPRSPLPVAHRRDRQPEQCRRSLNLVYAPHSPPPLAWLPLVVAAAVGSEGIKATNTAETTGRRRRKRYSRRPFSSLPSHRSPLPLPRLLLARSSGYG